MLTHIRNASAVQHASVSVWFSRLTYAIAEVLAREGWIGDLSKHGKKMKKRFDIILLYAPDGGAPVITGIRRVSTSTKRIYRGWKELRPIKQGYGMAIVSTPQGLLTNKEARKLKVGGEVLLEVW